MNGPLNILKRVTKNEPGSIHTAKQVGYHRERATHHIGKQQGGPVGLVDSAVDFGRFQVGVHRLGNFDQVTVLAQICDAVFKIAIAHGGSLGESVSALWV